jgi:hypothetical protein
MSDWQPLLNILAGVPVAVLTSWLTVRFSLGRFRSEKWFERRLDSYTKVIEALHFMNHCTETEMRAEVEGYEIDEKAKAELLASYAKGRSELRRLTDMGALIFSPEAVALLDTINSELLAASNAQSYWEHLDAEGAAIAKCLSALRPIAKRDLGA